MSLKLWMTLHDEDYGYRNLGLGDNVRFNIVNQTSSVTDGGKLYGTNVHYETGGIYGNFSSSLDTSYSNGTASVAFWVSLDELPSASNYSFFFLMGSTTGNANTVFGLGVYGNKWCAYLKGSYDRSQPCPLELGKWYHIVYTYDGNYPKLYVNGYLEKEFTTLTGGSVLSASKISIGCNVAGSGTNMLSGRICDFRYYDSLLSKKEIFEISKGLFLHVPFTRLMYPEYDNIIKNPSLTVGKYLNSSGSTTSNTNWVYTTDYIPISAGSHYTIQEVAGSATTNPCHWIYDSNKNRTRSLRATNYPVDFVAGNNEAFIRLTWSVQYIDNGVPNMIRSVSKDSGTSENLLIPCVSGYQSKDYYINYLSIDDNITYFDVIDNSSPVGESCLKRVKYDSGASWGQGISGLYSCLPEDEFTFNVWVKREVIGSSSNDIAPIIQFINRDEKVIFSLSFYTLSGKFGIFSRFEDDNGNIWNMNTEDTVEDATDWHMITVSVTHTYIQILLDCETASGGLLQGDIKFNSSPCYVNILEDKLHAVGSMPEQNANLEGVYISDMRLYGCSLIERSSEAFEGIKSLYNTRQSISDNGTFYAYELNEISSNTLHFNINGSVQSYSFEEVDTIDEDDSVKLRISGSSILSNRIMEV